jgi:hypothetical protein
MIGSPELKSPGLPRLGYYLRIMGSTGSKLLCTMWGMCGGIEFGQGGLVRVGPSMGGNPTGGAVTVEPGHEEAVTGEHGCPVYFSWWTSRSHRDGFSPEGPSL